MNTIKYLENKNQCPICNSPLIKDKGEIYCSHCGLLVLDYYSAPTASELLRSSCFSQHIRKKIKSLRLFLYFLVGRKRLELLTSSV